MIFENFHLSCCSSNLSARTFIGGDFSHGSFMYGDISPQTLFIETYVLRFHSLVL